VAELLGVWTSAAHRRQGFARALCQRLLADFFALGGEIVWLTAGSEESLGLYRDLGFERCGTHLDYADQAEVGSSMTRHS
jgi:ribosomal protein S18 acetylase RimI-like enzyme